MKCADVSKWLDDFVDGEFAPEAAAAVREHVQSCAECGAELAALKSLREATRALRTEIEPVEDLWQEIDAAIFCRIEYGMEGRSRVRSWVWRGPKWNAAGYAWRLTAAAAVALLVVAGVREWRSRGVVGGAGWEVTSLQGEPVVGTQGVSDKGTLRPGEWLETDATSRARIDVASIGHVTVGPASALRLKGSSEKEHRIELARGEVSAFIWAPPRLFFVETPSGVAEDLGCQYHLAVDAEGNGALEVTLGFVSFERDGREVVVPAGARCELRAKVGPGTPHEVNTRAELRDALARLDFDAVSSGAVDVVLNAATQDDAVTLWHLIPRTEGAERERVVDRLASFVPLPDKTTREGVIALDTRMLDRWWEEMYPSWTSWN